MSIKYAHKIRHILSPKGHEIAFYEYLIDKSYPNIFILGGFHGDEIEGEYAVLQFMKELETKENIQSLYNIYFLPCLNPDGKENCSRFNINKVDLNRNYPTQNFKNKTQTLGYESVTCEAPASEKETRFMISLVEEYHPQAIVSIHSDLHLIDYDGPAQKLAQLFADKTGYRIVESVGYETPGSFGTWAGIERKIPVITLETWRGKTDEDLEKIWQEIRPAFYAMLSFQL
ncbi:MAG: DUF2817 domain-containing protein [Alphaproteobacteria bacterium]|nr:DUF2817 domain-containing protein [Alphaproteobacteria bacterium]